MPALPMSDPDPGRDRPPLQTFLAVECARCGSYTEAPLTLLRAAAAIDCGDCGRPIDIASGGNRHLIDTFAQRHDHYASGGAS